MWIRFTDDFRFKPQQTVTQKFTKGFVVNATKRCADAAIAAGKAVAIDPPNLKKPAATKPKKADDGIDQV